MTSDGIYFFAKEQGLAARAASLLGGVLNRCHGASKVSYLGVDCGETGAALLLWDYLHGKERGGLKVSPLPLGKDLRKEGGRDNLPEVS